MTGSPAGEREPAGARTALTAMLEARSVALVGASPRPGTLGQRMITEVRRSPAAPRVYLVNPKYPEIAGMPCHPSLAALPGPVDLVMLGVPDRALAEQVSLAARRGDRSAVIFGGAFDPPEGPPGLRARIAATATGAGMAVCGAGCMGFANVSYGLRALGYTEPERIEAGPVALVTHSGSVFSALLRARRRTGFTVAVSSGQELVTSAAAFARYALGLPGTRVLALVLEAMREAGLLREVLAGASARDIPVVLLTAGRSASGRAMVAAHSGALAGDDGAWEALAGAYGVHRVRDLAEMADTLEVFAAGRRVRGHPAPAGGERPGTRPGIATVHDSGLERAHFADLADELGVPYAPLSEPARQRLAGVLGPGLEPANPLDMWDGSEGSRWQVAQSLAAFASDPAVAAVGLAVDLVPEFDGDRSYPLAVLDAAARTSKPVVVITNIAAAVDQDAAGELRAAGIPVLEGARSGLLALRHLLDHANRPAGPGAPRTAVADPARQRRWITALAHGEVGGVSLLRLLRDYGITAAQSRAAATASGALAAATEIGYPVVLKTGAPGIAHKSDVGGVVLGIGGPAALQRAYRDLAARLGPQVLVCETAPPGTELAVGITRDPDLGPLLVAGAGGLLVEFLSDRAVALPPVNAGQARELLSRLRVARLLEGVRGQPAAGLGAAADAVASVSAIARELGEHLAALDINPLICGPAGAVAADALLLPRLPAAP
jgi:acetate---CoA ligase (ADP-forming)